MIGKKPVLFEFDAALRQMRIECVKVCAPAQLQELVEGAHSALSLVSASR